MNKTNGFTLIELMIVVAVIGVLAMVAIPSYEDYVIQSRRADAKTALLQIQLTQEKWRANNTSYGTLAQLATIEAGIGTTADGHYTLSVAAAANTYTATATAAGTQATKDTKCANFSIDESDNQTVSGSYSGTPEKCWDK